MTDWIGWIGLIVGGIGTGTGAGGIAYAHVAKGAANSANRTAGEALRLQGQQLHDAYRPTKPATIVAEHRPTIAQGGSVFATVTFDRDYRVKVHRNIGSNGRAGVSLPLLVRAKQSYEFEVEQTPAGRTELDTASIHFRFWPPAEVDDVEQWDCRCGKPRGDETDSDPGHWSFTVPVERPPSPRVRHI